MTLLSDCTSAFSALIPRLDRATSRRDPERICSELKDLLSQTVDQVDEGLLPARALRANRESYARHLVHLDPAGRYSVVAMVWEPGQATPLHDHAGIWCVECVYQGRIRVTSYELLGEPDGELVAFRAVKQVVAGRGAAGALIPPFEYHTIDNPFDRTAVTLHVYGGEMTWCHAFYPAADGRYRRQRRELAYSD